MPSPHSSRPSARQARGGGARERRRTRARRRCAAIVRGSRRRFVRPHIDVRSSRRPSCGAASGVVELAPCIELVRHGPLLLVRRAHRGTAEEEVEERRLTRKEQRKKARAKSKAERAFTKQFGGSKPSDASQSGPRAAVYKGEMGAKHRQAARMQNAESPQASAKRGFSLGSLASLKSSPKFIASAAVAVCLVLSCAFLVPAGAAVLPCAARARPAGRRVCGARGAQRRPRKRRLVAADRRRHRGSRPRAVRMGEEGRGDGERARPRP